MGTLEVMLMKRYIVLGSLLSVIISAVHADVKSVAKYATDTIAANPLWVGAQAMGDSQYLLRSGHATWGKAVQGVSGIFGSGNSDIVYGRTALHFAAEGGSASTVKNLLNSGYVVDAPDKWGNTPLHLGCASGKGVVVDVLVNAGASPFAQNQHGDTPLVFAIFARNSGAVDVLLQKMDPSTKYRYLHTAGSGALVPLQHAVLVGSDPLTKVLLGHGADVNHYDTRTGTSAPLHIAAEQGLDSTTKLLLEHGADPFQVDHKGENALHKAAHARHSGVAEKLLNTNYNGRDGSELLDQKNYAGKTPLDLTESGSGFRRWMTRWKLGKWF